MTKYEEAVRLKNELVDYEKFVAETISRMQWTLPNRLAPDGQAIENTRKDLVVFNQILDAVKTLVPHIQVLVCALARQEAQAAVELAWGEMSELFKDFTMNLRDEVDALKKKIDETPSAVPAVMP